VVWAMSADSIKRGLISRVLGPALQLWVRSQVESGETLQIKMEGGDRQLLSGYLPRVNLQAASAIYQGLHLSHLKIVGENIRINIGQILKGKPLQLLEPVPLWMDVTLLAEDMQASLASGLLQQAIVGVLLQLVGEQIAAAFGGEAQAHELTLHDSDLKLGEGIVRLNTMLRQESLARSIPVTLQTGLALHPPNVLMLENPEWFPTPRAKRGLLLEELQGYRFDLGPLVKFETFILEEDRIALKGQLTVMP
jgi:hypothetical protein